ncbi:MAG: radical SAM protein, partial [Candidatus Limisoma sp.]|nr:radical SAM protein [Bacteroidales bacterium]MDY5894151.1 radical SAM protein [Candidatus Limisoma sp.]
SEPLISCKEILHFRKICRDKGHDWEITIETSLNVPKVFVEVLEGIVDYWIVDIKDMNPEIYKSYTGEENRQVIENLQHLIYNKARLTVRVP